MLSKSGDCLRGWSRETFRYGIYFGSWGKILQLNQLSFNKLPATLHIPQEAHQIDTLHRLGSPFKKKKSEAPTKSTWELASRRVEVIRDTHLTNHLMGCSASSFWDGWILVIRMWDVSKVVICIHRTPSLRCKQFWEIFFWRPWRMMGKWKGRASPPKDIGWWILRWKSMVKQPPAIPELRNYQLLQKQIYTCEHFPPEIPPTRNPPTNTRSLGPVTTGRCSARTRASNIPRRCQPMTSSLRQVVNFSVLWPSASRSWQSPQLFRSSTIVSLILLRRPKA